MADAELRGAARLVEEPAEQRPECPTERVGRVPQARGGGEGHLVGREEQDHVWKTALLERADPTPLRPIATMTADTELSSAGGSAESGGAPGPVRGNAGARIAKLSARTAKPEAVTALYKRDEEGKRSTSPPIGTEHRVYTTDEYMKTKETSEAEA
eukprot:CAMPEP_0196671882 /NCGR_PEP_ID=MMETSP1090-20130531/2081_1 /TAXON_ID=37098 /ORGANISM="Isochrysis sp, Strain CCMP1244" /LENGTH=155 /DNA_ID=CAMNT_0042009571 /DNA_START=356 /DNA_END=824 /DNA_ORIENTATION=+